MYTLSLDQHITDSSSMLLTQTCNKTGKNLMINYIYLPFVETMISNSAGNWNLKKYTVNKSKGYFYWLREKGYFIYNR